MRVKIISSDDWEKLREETDNFLHSLTESRCKVAFIKVTERYDLKEDYGYTAYHIFYKLRGEQNGQLEDEAIKLKKELHDLLRYFNKLHQSGKLEMPAYSIRRMVKLREEIDAFKKEPIDA